MAITCRVPTERDIVMLGLYLRKEDRQELDAVCDLSAMAAVRASVAASDPDFCRAWVDEWEQVICIGGCSPVSEGVAAPWLLGTSLLDCYFLTLHREAVPRVAAMREKYPHLRNVVDARQTRVITWLKRLGFVFSETAAWRPGLPLLQFEMRG